MPKGGYRRTEKMRREKKQKLIRRYQPIIILAPPHPPPTSPSITPANLALDERGHSHGGRVRSVRRSEGIVYVVVAQRRQLLAKLFSVALWSCGGDGDRCCKIDKEKNSKHVREIQERTGGTEGVLICSFIWSLTIEDASSTLRLNTCTKSKVEDLAT